MPTVLREAGFEVRIYTLDHPPPHVHVWKAGGVLKIDLTTHEAIEIVGTISDRGRQASGAPCGQKRGQAKKRMDQDSWQRLRSRQKIVSDTRKHVREEKHAQKIRPRWWTLDTIRTLTPLI